MFEYIRKYTSFTISNKLSFIDSFQFLSSSLDSLVKNLNQDDFRYLSQEYDNNVLDLVNKKDFILMNLWELLKRLKNNWKEKFYSPLTHRKISDKEY